MSLRVTHPYCKQSDIKDYSAVKSGRVRCIDYNIRLIYLGGLLSMSCQSGISYLFLLCFKNVYCSVLLVLVSKEFTFR